MGEAPESGNRGAEAAERWGAAAKKRGGRWGWLGRKREKVSFVEQRDNFISFSEKNS